MWSVELLSSKVEKRSLTYLYNIGQRIRGSFPPLPLRTHKLGKHVSSHVLVTFHASIVPSVDSPALRWASVIRTTFESTPLLVSYRLLDRL